MNTWCVMQKEIREGIVTPKGFIWYILASVILSILSYLFLTNSELSLLDQGEMVYMLMNLVAALGMLAGMVSGADSIAGEMERSTLETLLLSPAGKTEIATGKLGAAVANWVIILAISIPYLIVVGRGGHNLPAGIAYLAVLGTVLTAIFSSFSMGLSARTKSVKNSVVISFLILLLAGSPIFLSSALRGTWFGVVFDFINPFACAINTFDSVVVDGQGFSYQVGRIAVVCAYGFLSIWFLRRSMSKLEG